MKKCSRAQFFRSQSRLTVLLQPRAVEDDLVLLADKVEHIDYKDVAVLSKLTTQHGKLFSRKRSGNCASCQRKVKSAVKYARFLSLMPYVT